jgi:hypothetical protein
MYLKIVPKSYSSGQTQTNAALSTIYKVLNGTFTSTSDFDPSYIDQAKSVMSGALPSGIYHTFDTDTDTNPTNHGGSNYIEFYKNYYNNVTDTFEPSVKVKAGWSSYGFWWKSYDSNGENRYPSHNEDRVFSSNPGNTNGSFHQNVATYTNGFNRTKEIHMIATADTFMIYYMNSANTLSSSSGAIGSTDSYGAFAFMLNDLEYNASIDPELHTINSGYCPTVTSVMGTGRTIQEDGQSIYDYNTSSNYFRNTSFIVIGRQNAITSSGVAIQPYSDGMDASGNNTRPASYGASAHGSYNNYNVGSYFPSLAQGIKQFPKGNLNPSHLMIPVQYQPNHALSNNTDNMSDHEDVRHGGFANLFRTTDGFSKVNGTPVTVDGVTYRMFRLHKTADTRYTYAKKTACYLIKE